MKHMRATALILATALLLTNLTGCRHPETQPRTVHGASLTDTVRDANGKSSLQAPIPLSGFEDVTDKNGECAYQMTADLTDTYTFACNNAEELTVTTPRETVKGTDRVQAMIEAGETVTLTVSAQGGQKIAVTAQADNHLQRLPYTPNFTVDPSTLDTQGDGTKPSATVIEYQKRKGGTYVYLNNPEKLQPCDIGQALLRDEGLSGDVQVTWEHSNYTEQYIYLGYQLKNEGETDAYVTVTNIGYQIQGEWLGQQSWSDYYNYKFDLPEDYFDNGVVNPRYVGQDFIDYTPRAFQPTTYRIPAGEYIWLVGGTTVDAYNDTNVANTANKLVMRKRCTNAVAKCFITGGAVTGTFYCYTDIEQVQAEPEEQGYITMRDGEEYGYQYKGVDYHAALIESNPVFYINDSNVYGKRLPVTYTFEQASNYKYTGTPYAPIPTETMTVENYSWNTNISPYGRSNGAVTVDMSSFECVTPGGKTVTVDVNHRDGTGMLPNVGNWMIDYHDNMTFVNQSNRTRKVTINKSADGALMTMVIDPNGNVLKTKCTIVPLEEPADKLQWEIYSVEIPPHSTMQFCVSFLLMGNSNGNVYHWIVVE